MKLLEKFVCQVYSATGSKYLPALTWQLFKSKKLEVKCFLLPRLPCCPLSRGQITLPCVINPIKSDTLHSYKLKTMAGRWRMAYTHLCLPLPVPAPKVVIELTKCKCKTGCIMAACGCYKHGLPCTPLCKFWVCESHQISCIYNRRCRVVGNIVYKDRYCMHITVVVTGQWLLEVGSLELGSLHI